MPVPEKPYTRKEAYLNAAATGDTSGIPETPYTREEMYLDAIAKNGGGGGGGGGSSTLSGLTDVDISNPTDGQTLVYDAASQKWVNGESAGGGVLVCTVDYQTLTIDHTWQEMKDAAVVVLKESEGTEWTAVMYASIFDINSEDYIVYFAGITNDVTNPIVLVSAIASSANDYPVIQMNP